MEQPSSSDTAGASGVGSAAAAVAAASGSAQQQQQAQQQAPGSLTGGAGAAGSVTTNSTTNSSNVGASGGNANFSAGQLGAAAAVSVAVPGRSARLSACGVGARVIRGPDWKWGKQVQIHSKSYHCTYL